MDGRFASRSGSVFESRWRGGGAGCRDQLLEIGRDRHGLKWTDPRPARVAGGYEAKYGLGCRANEARQLPKTLRPLPHSPTPAKHKQMDTDVVAGRGLAQDMGTFEMRERRRGVPVTFGNDGGRKLPLDGW